MYSKEVAQKWKVKQVCWEKDVKEEQVELSVGWVGEVLGHLWELVLITSAKNVSEETHKS